MATGRWLIFVDPDEVYCNKDLQWLLDTIEKTDKVHVRYKSLNFWKGPDFIISGPHWDDTQERSICNMAGLKYTQYAFSVSINGEILAKKYGKKYEDGIYWANDEECKIFHYGMCTHPDKIRKKLRNYMLSDNPAVTSDNVESFVNRHPYFSGQFAQPRHGSKGLWVAGVDPGQREQVLPWKGTHPETMGKRVEEYYKRGKLLWER